MDVKSLHYSFKLAMDRVDTASSTDFNSAEIDWLLNQAQLIFIKQRFNADSNSKKRGFESSQKRIDDISTLLVKYPDQDAITPINLDGIYEVPLKQPYLSYDYLFLASARATVSINNCDSEVYLKFAQSDDLGSVLQDPFNRASLEFIPYNIGKSTAGDSSSMYIYPFTYTVKNVKVEYIKYPSRVSLGTYTYIDGVAYPPQTLQTPEHTHEEIVDIACQIAALAIENPEYIQLKNTKTLIHE